MNSLRFVIVALPGLSFNFLSSYLSSYGLLSGICVLFSDLIAFLRIACVEMVVSLDNALLTSSPLICT